MATCRFEINVERIPEMDLPWAPPSSPEEAETLSSKFTYLLSNIHEKLRSADTVLQELREDLPSKLREAFERSDSAALLELHKILFLIYELHFANPVAPPVKHERSPWLLGFGSRLKTAGCDMTCKPSSLSFPASLLSLQMKCASGLSGRQVSSQMWTKEWCNFWSSRRTRINLRSLSSRLS